MWFLLITILSVPVKGDYMTSICATNPYELCHTPPFTPEIIPRNEEELHIICPNISNHLDCLHGYHLNCGQSGYAVLESPLYYTIMKRFVDDACQENTDLHHVLTRYLPCIKRQVNAREENCSDTRNNVLNAYEEYYNAHIVYRRIHAAEESEAKNRRIECLYNVYTTACVLEDIQNGCGIAARNAGTLLYSTNIMVDNCGLDVFSELSHIVDYMYIDQIPKKMLKDFFVVYIN